jgi:hypothetical protein
MPNFHHVNLFVEPEKLEERATFLTEVLGYRKMVVNEQLRGMGANWFQADDGTEVHLSTRPHAAIHYGVDLAAVEKRLADAGIDYEAVDRLKAPDGRELRIVICKDPADNRWELGGVAPKP